jgi:beta-lactamase class A/pectin methylesterase-like acyl-CoA thioesterase
MIKIQQAFFHYFILFWVPVSITIFAQTPSTASNTVAFFPADNSRNINPDTHLIIRFPSAPVLGTTGKIKIYDLSDNRLVDQLDVSIPAGPTDSNAVRSNTRSPYLQVPYKYISGNFTNANTKPGTPSGGALPTPDNYQLTIIGGFTDGFHFYPVIIDGNIATIYLHNNLLEYNKTYNVQIDPGVLKLNNNSFAGITGNKWVFTTKKLPPSANSERLTVSADGSGDFNTVQGAIDFIPDYNPNQITIFIKNGIYQEIVYFRNKTNITILGEDRNKVIVKYANKETFNPHPSNISMNEVEGTFPSRRAAFSVDHSNRIHLVNFTIETTSERAQAEGLLLNGSENIVYNVNIKGSGDALQSNGSAYYSDCRIEGTGDVILGRGPAYFKDCEFRSSGGAYMWVRNSSANHGNVFVNCKFITDEGKETVIARSPANGSKNYPYCEAVLLNCKLAGISPIGWGSIGDTSNVHYWEYNSTNLSDGEPINISQRHPASRQLTMERDFEIIANYSRPAYILGNWEPKMASPFEDSLKTKIVDIVRGANGKVGLSVIGSENFDTLTINGSDKFPMQSVFKFPLALAILNQVDNGIFSLEQKIHLSKKDLQPDTWSPLRKKYPDSDVDITLDELLSTTVSQSDNNGCDKLFSLIGGTEKVENYIHELGIKDIAIAYTEEEMHRDWHIQYRNWCTPSAMAQLLYKFFYGKILSEKSREYLYQVMIKTSTSPGRLKGLLPEGTIVAHKSGSSGENKDGLAAATNDVGIITLPNGKYFIIAVFVSDSNADENARDNIIAEITKVVWDNYNSSK